jgi:hypothetical protein
MLIIFVSSGTETSFVSGHFDFRQMRRKHLLIHLRRNTIVTSGVVNKYIQLYAASILTLRMEILTAPEKKS